MDKSESLNNSVKISINNSGLMHKAFLMKFSKALLDAMGRIFAGNPQLLKFNTMIKGMYVDVQISKHKKRQPISINVLSANTNNEVKLLIDEFFLLQLVRRPDLIDKCIESAISSANIYIKKNADSKATRGIKNYNSKKLFGRPKALFFKNILNSPNKERGSNWHHLGTLYIISSLKQHNIPVVLSEAKISLNGKNFITSIDELRDIFKNNSDINFVGITLFESYFEKAVKLIKYIRRHSRAFIAVGGIMPSLSPSHVFVHMPDVNFVIRGQGEKVVADILNILGNANIDSRLSREQLDKLSRLSGILFSNRRTFISANIGRMNIIKNYDTSKIDFSFIQKDDVRDGMNFYTSCGCRYNCFFCTALFRGMYNAKSVASMKLILRDYQSRLTKLFTKRSYIPSRAFALSFYDDDFLADSERVIDIFEYIKDSPFYINFFQAGINSFLTKNKSRNIDFKLIKAITPNLFIPKTNVGRCNDQSLQGRKTWIYIGTENFSDAELARLGKGYNFHNIVTVVDALSKQGIHQTHHVILSNVYTTTNDLNVNFQRVIMLRSRFGEYFQILDPVTPNLISLFPSLSYKKIAQSSYQKNLLIRNNLKIKSYPEFNYSLVERDIPRDKGVSSFIDNFNRGDLCCNIKNLSRYYSQVSMQRLRKRQKFKTAQINT